MSANDTTYQIILDSNGIKAWTMPDEGYYPDVEIHCWGAGGGSGWIGAPGGGGGYAKSIVNINPGDEVTLQIGQPGRNAPSATGAGGTGGLDTTYQNFRGGNGGARGTWCGQNGGPYPSGGGGGASFVAVDGSFVCVAAGGGGGGGYGHDNFKDAGKPGGVYPGSASSIYAVTLSYAWNNFMNTYAVWGGGQDYTVTLNFPTTGTYTFNYAVDNYGSVYLDGNEIISYAGFSSTTTYTQTVSAGNHTVRVTGVNTGGPAGVAAQILKPDSSELWNTRALRFTSGLTTNFRGGDASYGGGGGAGYLGGASGFASGHTVTGGNGGLSYGGVTAAGIGTLPGGTATAYYPGKKIGEAGYPGYVVILLRKKFNTFIKNPDASGDWVRANIAYVKVPIRQVPGFREVPDQTIVYSSLGTTKATVPPYVSSITVTGHGGGGGGGSGDGGKNNDGPGWGGGGANRISQTYAVTPGQVLDITVGAGGSGRLGGGFAGKASTVTGTGVSFSAAGGAGGSAVSGWGGPGEGGSQNAGGPGANGAGSGGRPAGGLSTNGGANGGNGGPFNQRPGAAGQNGKVTVLYTGSNEPITITTGGWKPIQQAFTKVDNEWKPLLTNQPIELYNYPTKRRAVTINIVVPTYNFVVYDNLPVQYFEGLLDVNVYIAANTTVGSTDVTIPALLVNQFSPRDTVKISNYGTIAGRGGDGGAAGSYSVTTSYYYTYGYNTGCFLAGAMINTPDGLRAIEEIQVGDIVYAFNVGDNLDYSVALEPKVITKTYVHTWEEVGHTSPLIVITHSGGELVTTTLHEILTSSRSNPAVEFPGFVNAEDLQPGDIIYAADGSELTVISTRLGETYDLVYNLEVDDFHTYVADNVRVHNGQPSYNPKGGYRVGTTRVDSVAGRPGQFGGAGLRLDFPTVIENYGTIAGGGGGGGGGGGPTGGQGGGGAGAFPGNGGNNGTSTAGGAGLGLGGAGGARGTRGTDGTNSSSAGGLGGASGAAVVNIENAIVTVAGTTIGPIT